MLRNSLNYERKIIDFLGVIHQDVLSHLRPLKTAFESNVDFTRVKAQNHSSEKGLCFEKGKIRS